MKRRVRTLLAVCLLMMQLPLNALAAENDVWTLPLTVVENNEAAQTIEGFQAGLTHYQGLSAEEWCAEERFHALLAVALLIDFYNAYPDAPLIDYAAPVSLVRSDTTIRVLYTMPADSEYSLVTFCLEYAGTRGRGVASYLISNCSSVQAYAATLEGEHYEVDAQAFMDAREKVNQRFSEEITEE